MSFAERPTFTILVAAYNSEKYIRDCLDSLKNQSLSNIQIICIDDCSEDSTWDIMQEYAANDNRFLLIRNTENLGPSKSRNKGIDVATGEYICFLDSDDWFNCDSLQKTYDIFLSDKQIDCVLFDLILQHVSDSGDMVAERFQPSTPFATPLPKIITGLEALEYSIDWRIHGVYAAKTELFVKYPYDTTCRFYSDDNTTRIQYLHSKKVAFGNGIYNYRRFKQSGTSVISIHSFDHMLANLSLRKQLINEGVDDKIMSILETHRFRLLLSSFRTWWLNKSCFDSQETKTIKNLMKDVYNSLDKSKISRKGTNKFGYIPFNNYTLFYIEQYIFWTIRTILKMDKSKQ